MTVHLEVRLDDVLVGHLRAEDAGRASFRLDRGYLDRPRRPVLGQAFEDEPDRVWIERRGVPRWFGNLLPEPGSPLRAFLAEAHGVEVDDELAMLELLGNDLPGAVIVRRSANEVPAANASPDPDAGSDVDRGPMPRFSLAGVQLKFSMLMGEGRLTLPGPGELGNVIVKLTTGALDGVAEDEATMMAWARAAGFDVAPAHVVPVPDLPVRSHILDAIHPTALVVARFDRGTSRRIHQEDFAQVTNRPAHGKYEHVTYGQLGAVVHGVLGDDGFTEYVRRLALMVAQGNADAHLKNWSLRYTDPTRAAWSPLYDQVFTRAWPQVDGRLALKLAGHRHFGEIDGAAFEWLAGRVGVDPRSASRHALDTIDRLRDAFADLPERKYLRPEHVARLVDHWARVPILRFVGALRGQ